MNATTEQIVAALKSQYFAAVREENYPNTPAITARADDLERIIKGLMAGRIVPVITSASPLEGGIPS